MAKTHSYPPHSFFYAHTDQQSGEHPHRQGDADVLREASRELSREEYDRLLSTAHTLGRDRLALLMETICASGIRVSEVRYITVEAARQGQTEIALKGKIRTILLPDKLCRKLLKYARHKKIASGEIFARRAEKVWAVGKSGRR